MPKTTTSIYDYAESILEILRHSTTYSYDDIQATLHIPTSSMAKVMKQLEQEALIKRQVIPAEEIIYLYAHNNLLERIIDKLQDYKTHLQKNHTEHTAETLFNYDSTIAKTILDLCFDAMITKTGYITYHFIQNYISHNLRFSPPDFKLWQKDALNVRTKEHYTFHPEDIIQKKSNP